MDQKKLHKVHHGDDSLRGKWQAVGGKGTVNGVDSRLGKKIRNPITPFPSEVDTFLSVR